MRLDLITVRDWTATRFAAEPIANAEALGYSIDSRTLRPGDVFFAVVGERFDGHAFVEKAFQAGACAAVIAASRASQYPADPARPVLLADDPVAALQRLAASVRRHWGGRVIGITGSAGKTTTKEAVAQVLASRFRVIKSQGNLNNHLGLPLQLLRLEPEHEVAVIEMGMSHAGEIAALGKIAAPDWGIVTNVGMAHAENFPDGQAGIARAKYELIASLPSTGTAILNCDDPYVAQFGRDFRGKVIYFGAGACAVLRAEEVEPLGLEGTRFWIATADQRAQVHLRLMGMHNVLNALAAAAAGLASGIPLESCAAALNELAAGEKRGQSEVIFGATVINDCYNSNPAALRAMVDTLATVPAERRIVVAGEMLELGPDAAAQHGDCGRYMAKQGVAQVIGVRGLAKEIAAGAAAAGAPASFVDAPEEAGEWLAANLRPGDVVLLKASRGVRLERALEVLRQAAIERKAKS
jgi:UDP-N-acetylmuramoyl-tripeptide--D-alanyl-D-alanine ligase